MDTEQARFEMAADQFEDFVQSLEARREMEVD
jgi:exonuclease VII small subunit